MQDVHWPQRSRLNSEVQRSHNHSVAEFPLNFPFNSPFIPTLPTTLLSRLRCNSPPPDNEPCDRCHKKLSVSQAENFWSRIINKSWACLIFFIYSFVSLPDSAWMWTQGGKTKIVSMLTLTSEPSALLKVSRLGVFASLSVSGFSFSLPHDAAKLHSNWCKCERKSQISDGLWLHWLRCWMCSRQSHESRPEGKMWFC